MSLLQRAKDSFSRVWRDSRTEEHALEVEEELEDLIRDGQLRDNANLTPPPHSPRTPSHQTSSHYPQPSTLRIVNTALPDSSRNLQPRIKRRTFEDERRLLGDFRNPADATRIPIPGSELRADSTMPNKPYGAFKPVDTLNDTRHHTSQRKTATTTYGTGRAAFGGRPLPVESHRGADVRPASHIREFPDREDQAKRRKLAHTQLKMSREVYTVDDDDEEKPHVVERVTHTYHPYGSQTTHDQSRRSSFGLGPRMGLGGSQEFVDVESRFRTNQRRGRQKAANGNLDEIDLYQATVESGRISYAGRTQDNVIVVQDEDKRSAKDVMSALESQLKRRDSRKSATATSEISQYFEQRPTEQRPIAPVDLTQEDDPIILQESAPRQAHRSSKTGNLPQIYEEKAEQNQLEVNLKRHNRASIQSVDELSGPPTNTREQNDYGRGLRYRQESALCRQDDDSPEPPAASDIPPTNFARAQPEGHVPVRKSKSDTKKGEPPAWLLSTFRNSPSPAIEGRLILRWDPANELYYLVQNHQVLPKTHNIFPKDIQRVMWDPNGSVLVRLAGTRNVFFDLAFKTHQEAKTFITTLSKRALGNFREYEKGGLEMKKMFEKWPTNRGRNQAVDEGEEQELMEERVKQAHEQKAARARQTIIAQSDRPRRGGILRSQQQTSVPGSSFDEIRYEEPDEDLDRTLSQVLEAETRRSARPIRTRASRLRSPDLDLGSEEAKHKERYSVKFGIKPIWEQSVVFPMTGKKRTTVEYGDLERLDDDQFLNDNLIEFYIRWLTEQHQPQNSQVYFFGTHFYTALTTQTTKGHKGLNYEAVQRWTAKDDIFSHDYVVVPVNESFHWYLAIICNLPNVERKRLDLDLDPVDVEQSIKSEEQSHDKDIVEEVQLTHERIGGQGAGQSSSARNNDNSPGLSDPLQRMNMGLDRQPRHEDATAIPEPVGLVRETAADEIPDSEDERQQKRPKHASSTSSPPPVTQATLDPQQPDSQSTPASGVFATAKTKSPTNSKKNRRKSVPPRHYGPDTPMVVILDSLGLSHSRTISNLKDYIILEGREKRSLDISKDELKGFHAKVGIPQQNNYSDCGLYVCGYTDKFMQDPKTFGKKLLAQEFDMNEDWPEMNPTKMRTDMRKLLQDIYAKQVVAREAEKKAKKELKRKSKKIGGDSASSPLKRVTTPDVAVGRPPSSQPQPSKESRVIKLLNVPPPTKESSSSQLPPRQRTSSASKEYSRAPAKGKERFGGNANPTWDADKYIEQAGVPALLNGALEYLNQDPIPSPEGNVQSDEDSMPDNNDQGGGYIVSNPEEQER